MNAINAQVDRARLVDVSAKLSELVEKLSRKWAVGGGRLTKKRAEAASLLALYDEVVIILDRINREGIPAVARMLELIVGPMSKQDLHDEVEITQLLMPRLAVDLKSLYHWSYAIEDFLAHSSAKKVVDLTELRRISIFRHKMMVHQARTPMRRRGRVPSSHRTWGPDPENFRVMSHPMFQGLLWFGFRRKLARLNPYIPGLKQEANAFVKLDLVYRHFNAIPEGEVQWVRNELFGAVGLWSDPPVVVASALLKALKDYVAARRL
jgi:hypothetical protein